MQVGEVPPQTQNSIFRFLTALSLHRPSLRSILVPGCGPSLSIVAPLPIVRKINFPSVHHRPYISPFDSVRVSKIFFQHYRTYHFSPNFLPSEKIFYPFYKKIFPKNSTVNFSAQNFSLCFAGIIAPAKREYDSEPLRSAVLRRSLRSFS